MTLNKAKQLLCRDILSHISMLKMLDAYGDSLACTVLERDRHWGVLLCVPTQLSSYDRTAYPSAESVVFMSGSDNVIISELIGGLNTDKPLIFKIQRGHDRLLDYRPMLEKKFRLEKTRSFYSYTCQGPISLSRTDEIIEENTLNDRLLPLWTLNGYKIQEIQRMFELGARSYSLYANGIVVSTCLTFCNYGPVWEIGAVHTIDEYRGKGLAKAVVAAAVDRLLKDNMVPRYQVTDQNMASIRVAESLGLRRAVTLDHYYGRDKRLL